ncbi:MAG: hypothetical protein IJK66_01045 [Bacilli bacterium]|nr:hypothetical protein [Bacilli bacterium]
MNGNLKNFCKNYNIIVNCEFLDDDLFSKKLVDFYKNAINKTSSTDENSLKKLAMYDKVMKKYIDDYAFSKKLRNSVDISSILRSKIDLTDAVLDYAVAFSNKYNDREIDEPIVTTRWI